MTDKQQDLKNSIENQKNLINEINELSNTISVKKELALKYQGIIEYLTASGVTLPIENEVEVSEPETLSEEQI